MGKRKTGAERAEKNERATAVNVAALYSYGLTTAECVEAVISAPSVENLIEHAKSGDTASAKEVLALISGYLMTEIHGPMPPSLRQYLGNALAKASLGESADVTLNLKRSGRPRRRRYTKLIIALRIYESMRDGMSLEDASAECEELFKDNIRVRGELYGYTKAPNTKTLEGIYAEVLPELEGIYAEVRRIGSSLKT